VADNATNSGLSISEWITAAATTATALIAWFAYRYTLRTTDPIVECDDPEWGKGSKTIIVLNITARNRSTISHGVTQIEVQKPKGSIMTLRDLNLMPAQVLKLPWLALSPVGTTAQRFHFQGNFPLDSASLIALVSVPATFVSGKLRIVLTISDKSPRPRTKRFVISKFIQAQPTMSNAETTNKID